MLIYTFEEWREDLVVDFLATGQFESCVCGAVSVVAPQTIADEAPVSCGGCGRVIGSWLAYKSFVSRAIGRETHGLAQSAWICVDPMPLLPAEEACDGAFAGVLPRSASAGAPRARPGYPRPHG